MARKAHKIPDDDRDHRSSSTNTTTTMKNAERERSRVRLLRNAFQQLQHSIPTIPVDTKLSKLDILILATNYIQVLMNVLEGTTDDHHHHHHQHQHQPTPQSIESMTTTELTGAIYDQAPTVNDQSPSHTLPSLHQNQPLHHHDHHQPHHHKIYRPIKKWPMRSRLYSPANIID